MPVDLQSASHDESSCPPSLPDAVVWPLTTDEVSRVVRYAYEQEIPVTARGAGSSLEGNPIPVRGGLVLDLSRMDQIVTVHAGDLQVTVQPGIVYNQLNEQLKPYGLFFPPAAARMSLRLAAWWRITPVVFTRSNTAVRATT
jgi:FAD/FMN-containing dehydrogenase